MDGVRECSLFMGRGSGKCEGGGANEVLLPYIGESERFYSGEEGSQ